MQLSLGILRVLSLVRIKIEMWISKHGGGKDDKTVLKSDWQCEHINRLAAGNCLVFINIGKLSPRSQAFFTNTFFVNLSPSSSLAGLSISFDLSSHHQNKQLNLLCIIGRFHLVELKMLFKFLKDGRWPQLTYSVTIKWKTYPFLFKCN